MLNDLTLVGRLAKDIEMSYLHSGLATAKTSLAINEKYKDKETTTFIDLRIFGRTAEYANQYTQKGSMVLAKGKLRIEDYQNDKGENKRAVYCLVEKLVFLSSSGNNNTNSQNTNDVKPSVYSKKQSQVNKINQDDCVEIEDNSELPF